MNTFIVIVFVVALSSPAFCRSSHRLKRSSEDEASSFDWFGPLPWGPNTIDYSRQNEVKVCERDNIFYGIQPHPSRCDQYILCSNSITHEIDCPSRDIRAACRISEERCKTASLATFYQNANDLTMCETQNIYDGVFPHPFECEKYLRCSNSVTQQIQCPSRDARTACDLKDSQNNCQNRQGDTDWAPEQHGRDSTYCKDLGLTTGVHADPQSCYGYIVCTYGKTNYMPCPTGRAYSPHRVACINENHVDCSAYRKTSYNDETVDEESAVAQEEEEEEDAK